MKTFMETPVSEFKSKSGLGRIVAACRNSAAGFRAAWRTEHAFRQEVVVLIFGVILACALKISAFERFVLIGVLVFVLCIELVNSALEAVVDRISLERHPLSKNAKDFGSAAVTLAILLAAGAWIVVLFNRFY
jgi:diacylglycerol kinase (ATP)